MLNQYALYLIIGEDDIGEIELSDLVSCAISNGVTAVQLRGKNSTTRNFVDLGKKLKKLLLAQDKYVPLIINDRTDIALAVEADGVHIGQTDIDYFDARKILGENAIIGLTVETLEQAEAALELGVDYLGLSAVFSTPTKPEALPYWTPEKIKTIRPMTKQKLIGIGGINQSNAGILLNAGLDGIAISSFICQATSLTEVATRTRKLRFIMEGHNG
jgi:thiamine-phosphate pyrophosphorylase